MKNRAYLAGVVVQGLLLGVLLFVAITTLLTVAGDARLFRYQAY